ncbi:MAG: hypothetical protein ACT4OJ_05260 [Bacteroidota bacterium]
MKKLLSLLAIMAMFSFVACNNEKKDDKTKADGADKIETTVKDASTTTTQLVAHVCTDQCKDGNHLYAHGEEGHTCSEACMKSHSCTEACKDGNHVYAHGEKGHTCASADCGKM